MSLSEPARQRIRELVDQAPEASPELIARLRAIFAGADTPDSSAAGARQAPAAMDSLSGTTQERVSRGQDNTAA